MNGCIMVRTFQFILITGFLTYEMDFLDSMDDFSSYRTLSFFVQIDFFRFLDFTDF